MLINFFHIKKKSMFNILQDKPEIYEICDLIKTKQNIYFDF